MSISWILLVTVAAEGLFLGVWGKADLDHRLSVLPFEADLKPCFNVKLPASHVGRQRYQRYFANDSLIGRPVPCTRDDKICFRHNLVFDPATDRCEPFGKVCDTLEEKVLLVDRTELEHGSGRVIGSCQEYNNECSGYRMAYDGVCYEKVRLGSVICGCDAILTRHLLGGMECRDEPITPISVQQPEEDGLCVIPDLRNPDTNRSHFFAYPVENIYGNLTCDRSQMECFHAWKIWVSEYEGCHALLEQGPCAEDHVVALDAQAASEGRAEGTCVHVRGGCPKGYKRMVFDGECHEDREIAIAAPGKIILDAFGRHFVVDRDLDLLFQPSVPNGQFCSIQSVPLMYGGFQPMMPVL